MVAPDASLDDALRAALEAIPEVRVAYLFGSRATGRARPDSDLDVLVEFEDGHTPGFVFFDIQAELSRVVGRTVDLNTPQFLSPAIRDRVEAEAEIVFGDT